MGSGAGPLAGSRIVLGVTGGVAAYKAVEVCRLLVAAGAHVSPVLTGSARRFVGQATFSALASEPVRGSLWEGPEPIPHTHLGQSADLVVVAPATARFVAAYAGGLCDDLLVATLLATRAPVLIAPAMHAEMWEHPAVADNVALLRRRDVALVGPVIGPLAGADAGPGRMAEPAAIVAAAAGLLAGRAGDTVPAGDLAGIQVLVSAGGTREALDPVRFIANRSSGQQGHALAEEAARRGASVTLVTTADRAVPPGVSRVAVETAAEMEQAMLDHAQGADVVVMAAAVADFRLASPHPTKLDKSRGLPALDLEATPDILVALGRARRPGQVLVGFAAETCPDPAELVRRAAAKLAAKGVDLMVANDVSAPDIGFAHDTNAVTIVAADGQVSEVGPTSKTAVAQVVLDAVVARLAR